MRIKTDPSLPRTVGAATILPTVEDTVFLTDEGHAVNDVCECRIVMKTGEPIFAWVKHIVTGLDVVAVKKEGEA